MSAEADDAAEREAYRRGARDVLKAQHRLALAKISVPHYRSRWRDAWAILSKSVERGEWPPKGEGEGDTHDA